MLYAKLNCSKIIITSGYRCAKRDKNVGGSGTGQHTKGNAADTCCYGQDGKPISSKTVCCAAQDIGFGGIANITTAYQYTHVDVRSGSKWYGDETKGNSSVTSDFYTYFGMKKESDSMEMKGIDVSVHNGAIDWNKVKASGISENCAEFQGVIFTNDNIYITAMPKNTDKEHLAAFCDMITLMNRSAIEHKRIFAKKINEDNEKFAMRIWLDGIGLKGAEYRKSRCILMKPLHGISAFRTQEQLDIAVEKFRRERIRDENHHACQLRS